MQLLGIEDAMKLSSSVLVGFGDMYIPPLLLANEPALSSRFILGVVTTSQIIYLTEIGAIILKSPMKVNIFQLFIIFIERTIIALPIAVILFKLFL
jgi:nucleoside recognition membrane protein YjiH